MMMSQRLWWSRRVGLMMCVIGLWLGDGWAQVRSGNELPEALINIKPADGVCKKDQAIAAWDQQHGHTDPIVIDRDCARTAQQVVATLGQPDVLLVDLRQGQDFQRFHVKGASQLTLSQLLSKPYLQSKSLVLIGDARDDRETYLACTQLRQAGFQNTTLITGGMSQWLLHGLPVEGKAPLPLELSLVSAPQLWARGQSDDQLVVLDARRASLSSQFPKAKVVSTLTPDALTRVVTTPEKKKTVSPWITVTLVTDQPLSAESYAELQRAIMPLPLSVYTGSDGDYAAALKQQKAIWVAQAKGPKTLGCGL